MSDCQGEKIQALEVLAKGLAHNINNILAAMMLCSEIIGMEVRSKDANIRTIQDYNERALVAGRRMAEIVRKMMMFGQCDIEANLVYFDLGLFLARTLDGELIKNMLPSNIYLEIEIAKEDSVVFADKNSISQILTNLVVNAKEAMPTGGILRIGLKAIEEANRDWAVLTVCDSGDGMSLETQRRIFEPFFTTRDIALNQGLGLSVVYGIVSQIGGRIDIVSKEGEGTSVLVKIPLVDSNTVKEKITPIHRGNKETILLVEDDESLRTAISVLLEEAGYTIIQAKDGQEGFLLYKRDWETIKLVISDISMPNMDGQELYRKIIAENSQQKFIFISGFAATGLIKKSLTKKETRVEFVSKPFQLPSLLTKINEFLQD